MIGSVVTGDVGIVPAVPYSKALFVVGMESSAEFELLSTAEGVVDSRVDLLALFSIKPTLSYEFRVLYGCVPDHPDALVENFLISLRG